MIKKTESKSELVAAIVKSIGSMGKIAKENMNQFDKYKFVSIDDFLEATGRVCSENGLIVVQNELDRSVIEKKGKQWILVDFEFTVYHESGESLPPLRRSVSVPFNGAQAFGSAQSYSLKQFMRSLFQITTGDADDPDSQPTAKPESMPAAIPQVGISEATRKQLVDLSQSLSAFPAQDIFLAWVERVSAGGKKLDDLSEKQGRGLLDYLGKKGDASKWSSKYLEALTAVMNQSAAGAPY